MPVVASHAFVAIKQHLLGLLEPVDVVRQFLFVVFEIGVMTHFPQSFGFFPANLRFLRSSN